MNCEFLRDDNNTIWFTYASNIWFRDMADTHSKLVIKRHASFVESKPSVQFSKRYQQRHLK